MPKKASVLEEIKNNLQGDQPIVGDQPVALRNISYWIKFLGVLPMNTRRNII